MTVLVLEGLNGLGKTKLARFVCSTLGYKKFKPFDVFSGEHWDEADTCELEALGVPFNTLIEDLFVADFLGTFPSNVVLDRSLPSGIVYNGVATSPETAFVTWKKLFRGAPVAYVWLDGSFELASERSPGRVGERKIFEERRELYGELFGLVPFPKLRLNAGADFELKAATVLRMIGAT